MAKSQSRVKRKSKRQTSSNNTGIHPVGFCVLIKLDPVRSVTLGGVHVPEDRLERDQMAQTHATIIELGDRAFEELQQIDGAEAPEVGDRVMVNKYGGVTPRAGDTATLYRLTIDKEVTAIMDHDYVPEPARVAE